MLRWRPQRSWRAPVTAGGRYAKANLNLGDCAAYALAKSLHAPLLFKGVDFRHTDVTAAL